MKGKDKCRILKQIRKKIADENDIPYVIEECPHKGECKGTCPRCEAEVRQMEEALSLRRRLGKGVAIAGIAAGVMATATACTPQDVVEEVMYKLYGVTGYHQLEGDVIEGEAQPYYPYEVEGVAPNEPELEGGAPYYEDEGVVEDDCEDYNSSDKY
ncbi:MAG: hypothetical protein K6F11_01475 [Lachnospiraceae bacterium]|nr:hypothetical protein [Lachnospiraceae bacterium]